MIIRWQEFHIYELLLLLPVIDTGRATITDWGYGRKDGPSEWKKNYPMCGGSLQSPIHIETSRVWHTNSLTTFNMIDYETIPPNAHWGLVNTGRYVKIDLQGEYILEEGALIGQYRAYEMRLHWGSDEKHGSEHMIDNYLAPMELQLLHYNAKYSSIEEAYKQEDGIAILAFLFTISARDNLGYVHLLNHLTNITYPGDKVNLRPLPLLTLLPQNLNDYYRYQGSDTAPPCAETAIWSIFTNYIDISNRQLERMRFLLKTSARNEMNRPMMDNYRPLQDLNDRTVYSSHPDHATVYSSPLSFPISVTVAAFFGILLIIVVMR